MSGKGSRPRHNLEVYRSAPYWRAKENLDQSGPAMTGPTSKSCNTPRDHCSEAQAGQQLQETAING